MVPGDIVNMATICKKIFQLVLLFGSESWVVTRATLKLIEGFHHLTSRRITGTTVRHTTSEEWEWSPVAYAIDTKGFWSANKYI